MAPSCYLAETTIKKDVVTQCKTMDFTCRYVQGNACTIAQTAKPVQV